MESPSCTSACTSPCTSPCTPSCTSHMQEATWRKTASLMGEVDDLRAEIEALTSRGRRADEVSAGQRSAAQETLLAALDAREELQAQLQCAVLH